MKSSSLLVCLAVFCLFTVTLQQEAAEFTPLSADQVGKDPAAKGARDYGYPFIVDKAIASGRLAQDTYTIAQVVTASQQPVDTGVNYKFSVIVANADKSVNYSIGYTVYRGNEYGEYFLSRWWY